MFAVVTFAALLSLIFMFLLVTALCVSTRDGHHQAHVLSCSYCTVSMQTAVSCIHFFPDETRGKNVIRILLVLKLMSLISLKWRAL